MALALSLASCTAAPAGPPVQPPPVSTPLPTATLCPSIQRGLKFLNARYNPDIGLLNEAPKAAPDKYWLTNDNALAAYTFSQLDKLDMSAIVHASLQRYGYETNGLIEVVWGLPVSYPPDVARPVMVSKVGSAEIWQEFHDDGPRYEDWAQYANLGFLGALNAYHQGQIAESHAIFSNTLAQFDGTGLRDQVYEDQGLYETYKLALALYTGAIIRAPVANGDQLLAILQAMQAENGGFTTHYRDMHTPDGDENTETTSFAILAQKVYGCASH